MTMLREVVKKSAKLVPTGGGIWSNNPWVPTCILKMGTEKGVRKKIKVGSQVCGGGGSGNLGQSPKFSTFFFLTTSLTGFLIGV